MAVEGAAVSNVKILEKNTYIGNQGSQLIVTRVRIIAISRRHQLRHLIITVVLLCVGLLGHFGNRVGAITLAHL